MNLKVEKELVEKAKTDPQVFGKIFDEYYPKIFKYVLHRTGDVSISEDITSNVFFIALKKLWQFSWKGITISSWLFRIATNEINGYYRKNKLSAISLDQLMSCGLEIKEDLDIQKEIEELEFDLSQHKIFLQVLGQMHQMKMIYQEVITLRFFEDKSIREISEILGKREGTIKSLISRGLIYLRKRCSYLDLEEEPTKVQPIIGNFIIDSNKDNIN